MQRTQRPVERLQEGLHGALVQVPQLRRGPPKGLGLRGRSEGDPQVPSAQARCVEGIALHEVRFDRDRRSPELVEQVLRTRVIGGIGRTKREEQRLVGPLPRDQRLIAAHVAIILLRRPCTVPISLDTHPFAASVATAHRVPRTPFATAHCAPRTFLASTPPPCAYVIRSSSSPCASATSWPCSTRPSSTSPCPTWRAASAPASPACSGWWTATPSCSRACCSPPAPWEIASATGARSSPGSPCSRSLRCCAASRRILGR